jgi:hypothetical protein
LLSRHRHLPVSPSSLALLCQVCSSGTHASCRHLPHHLRGPDGARPTPSHVVGPTPWLRLRRLAQQNPHLSPPAPHAGGGGHCHE